MAYSKLGSFWVLLLFLAFCLFTTICFALTALHDSFAEPSPPAFCTDVVGFLWGGLWTTNKQILHELHQISDINRSVVIEIGTLQQER